MNRRNFIKNILVAGASFSVLPGAGRIWKATRSDIGIYFALRECPPPDGEMFVVQDWIRRYWEIMDRRRALGVQDLFIYTDRRSKNQILKYMSKHGQA